MRLRSARSARPRRARTPRRVLPGRAARRPAARSCCRRRAARPGAGERRVDLPVGVGCDAEQARGSAPRVLAGAEVVVEDAAHHQPLLSPTPSSSSWLVRRRCSVMSASAPPGSSPRARPRPAPASTSAPTAANDRPSRADRRAHQEAGRAMKPIAGPLKPQPWITAAAQQRHAARAHRHQRQLAAAAPSASRRRRPASGERAGQQRGGRTAAAACCWPAAGTFSPKTMEGAEQVAAHGRRASWAGSGRTVGFTALRASRGRSVPSLP